MVNGVRWWQRDQIMFEKTNRTVRAQAGVTMAVTVDTAITDTTAMAATIVVVVVVVGTMVIGTGTTCTGRVRGQVRRVARTGARGPR